MDRRCRCIAAALLICALGVLLAGCNREYSKDHRTSEFETGYEAGLEDAAISNMSSNASTNEILEYLDYGEIVQYVEDAGDVQVWAIEDLQALFAYALQRGYVAGKTGTWDSTMEEYVSGYDVTDCASEFEHIFGLDPIHVKSPNGLYLDSWANGDKKIDYSKVFDAWQDWAAQNK